MSYTDDDEQYIRNLSKLIEEGGLPKQTSKVLSRALSKEANPLKILAIFRSNIASELFNETAAEGAMSPSYPREVILSEYMVGK